MNVSHHIVVAPMRYMFFATLACFAPANLLSFFQLLSRSPWRPSDHNKKDAVFTYKHGQWQRVHMPLAWRIIWHTAQDTLQLRPTPLTGIPLQNTMSSTNSASGEEGMVCLSSSPHWRVHPPRSGVLLVRKSHVGSTINIVHVFLSVGCYRFHYPLN